MEHVTKEKSVESKFFEPPDPGDKGLDLSRQGLETDGDVEEEMDEYQSDASSEDGGDSSIKLSSRFKRLINDQGVNWYRLRSGEGAGKVTSRTPFAVKPKQMKGDKGPNNKPSDSHDKENRQVNLESLARDDERLVRVRDIEVLQSGEDGIVETSTPSHVDSHIDGETVQMNMEYAGITNVVDGNMQHLLQVNLLDNWNNMAEGEVHSIDWMRVCKHNEETKNKEDEVEVTNLYNRMKSIWGLSEEDMAFEFCYKDNLALMGLQKWHGLQSVLCKVGKRKKKHARGSKGPRDSIETGYLDKRESTQEIETEGTRRKNWKIWNSKNRTPKKNLSKTSHMFKQVFIPKAISDELIIYNEFRIGKDKDVENKGKVRIFNNDLLKKLREKEERLVEIARRINTSKDNSTLINSLIGMAKARITKFSAKINEEGQMGRGGTSDTRRNVDLTKPKWVPEVQNRNIVGKEKPKEIPKNSRANEETSIYVERPRNADHSGVSNLNKRNNIEGNNRNKGLNVGGSQGTSVIETSNRYVLLDKNGIEMELGNEGDLNQAQRIEAKQHVVKKQIPDLEVAAKWPKHLVNYFRQLSHLFGFVEGFSWASKVWEKGMDGEDLNSDNSPIPMEEVESETDGTAVFMKLDNALGSHVHRLNDHEVTADTPKQVDTDIYPTENPLIGVNEC
ncbi:hypothetical protein L1987_76430 [Smallanthus sonchifolius]|uniref:Uncharacterized protein n=1 Tax=Smallanthus sonchifolius TaxID=185202 RepID=A0ACB8Z648_9ASTR|nr:hypothetical protein L1987_76430 [Smallanthus sonchifolius]